MCDVTFAHVTLCDAVLKSEMTNWKRFEKTRERNENTWVSIISVSHHNQYTQSTM